MERTRKRILIADDDPGIIDVLILFLEEMGYEVEATDAIESLQTFQNGLPQLLLLDIWLSGWSGKDICQTLKSQKETKHLPVILFSANRDAEAISREAGADDFIAKPFELDELLLKLGRYL